VRVDYEDFSGVSLSQYSIGRAMRGGMRLMLSRCANRFTVETTEWEGVWDR